MKKITLFLALVLICASLCSCGGPELIGLIPAYNGLPVTDTRHEFAKEDFYVLASFDDGTDRKLEPEEFDMEVLDLRDGYYTVEFSYKGEKQNCYVECFVNVYPSDLASPES